MERFTRKLALLNIPVYDIDDESEILEIALRFMKNNVRECDESAFKINKVPAGSIEPHKTVNNCNELVLFEALLGIDESAIIFLDQRFLYYKTASCLPFSILIHESNIVESIEVALHRISSCSSYYSCPLHIVRPKDLSELNQVFILNV